MPPSPPPTLCPAGFISCPACPFNCRLSSIQINRALIARPALLSDWAVNTHWPEVSSSVNSFNPLSDVWDGTISVTSSWDREVGVCVCVHVLERQTTALCQRHRQQKLSRDGLYEIGRKNMTSSVMGYDDKMHNGATKSSLSWRRVALAVQQLWSGFFSKDL